jgi:beta-mannosidase
MLVRTAIDGGWSVVASGGPGADTLAGRALPASVPGCVHTDLVADGAIPDPFLQENERATSWVGRTDWTYTTTLSHPAAADGQRIELVAHGLDTVADVRLDGALLGSVRNMHRTHRFDVTHLLNGGEQVLEVAFRSPLAEAEAASARLGARPHVNEHPYNAVRKNASSFGWDWGPDLSTSGIWRPIVLEAWSVARISSVRTQVDVRTDGTGVLDVVVEVERAADDALDLAVTVDGVGAAAVLGAGATSASVRVQIPDVERWWPHGYGGQRLYDVGIELSQGGQRLDGRTSRVGFRTVRVEIPEDAQGTGFVIVVNDRPVLVRGYNWIPDDALVSRVDRGRYESRIREAVASNANLLRVWGGGIYESDDFYDVCDELGVLVWQDFLFACAAYAEEDELAAEVEAEAREAVARLSGRASLTLWCGGNECLWGYEDWDWKRPLDGRTWGAGFYRGLLPAIVAELDPSRPYIPGSPFSPRADRHPNDPSHGPMHIWDVWNERDYTAYLGYRPRFVSEFGFQGPPTWSTLTRALDEDSLDPWSPGMLAHQKAEDGNGKLERGMAPHLPAPTTFEDWHWATSLNQARAVALGVEHFRSLAPRCTGVVVWQLNDCWPVTSWAAVDGDGRRKPLWYALRRAFADRHVALLPEAGGQLLAVVNDSDEPWRTRARIRRMTWSGEVLAETTLPVGIAERGALRIPLPDVVAQPADPADELLVVDIDGLRSLAPFAEDVDSLLPDAVLDVDVRPADGGYDVVVTAGSVVRDLALLVDRAAPGAVVNDMLVALLPGETAVFRVTSAEPLDPARLAARDVVRCANDLAAAARAGVPAG